MHLELMNVMFKCYEPVTIVKCCELVNCGCNILLFIQILVNCGCNVLLFIQILVNWGCKLDRKKATAWPK